MTRLLSRLLLLFAGALSVASGSDVVRGEAVRGELTAEVRQRVRPVLIRNEHNALLQLTIDAGQVPDLLLTSLSVTVKNAPQLESLQVYAASRGGETTTEKPFGERLAAAADCTFRGSFRLSAGANHFWISCRVRPEADLTATVDAAVTAISTSAGNVVPRDATPGVAKRIGVALRRHWDDGVHTYRIPALATTSTGTLLCVYDMRRRMGRDLQEDIDIGLVRSTDGGQTWEPQRVIMDMGTTGGLGQELNGCSDPGILVDPQTGEIFCFAVWMHGRAGKHQWSEGGSEPGFAIGESAQFMLVRSRDDGKTWSPPENMTRHWKRADWILYAPSPQQGIALADGTLVMPTQGRDAQDRKFSNLLVSRDHGATWSVSPAASLGNSECQAAVLSDGRIMLNCRTERPTKVRTVAVTADLGETWTIHPTSRKALIEPNCNGSLYRFPYRAADGAERGVLLFANPHSQQGRTHHTVQVSLDDGASWPQRYHLLLDEGRGAGYPSLSRVDPHHVGIVYEGSGAHLVFQKIPLELLLRGDR